MKKIAMVIGVLVLNIQAQTIEVLPADSNQEIQEHPFAIVMLYHKTALSNVQKDHLFYTFRTVSKHSLYCKARLQFIEINADATPVHYLLDGVFISRTPAFALFKDGRPVLGSNGKAVVLYGFAHQRDLQLFINAHLLSSLQKAARVKHKVYYYAHRPRKYLYYYGGPYYPYTGINFGINFGI